MTDEQRNQFRILNEKLDALWKATQAAYAPMMAVRPDRHGMEWDEAYLAIEGAIGRVAELVEAEENLQILMGLPERK